MTALPNPFLSASDGLHPLSSVAVASGIPYKPQGATAEILSSPGVLLGSLPSGEIEPSVMLASMPGGPADVTSTSPEAMSAGTNSAWVRDCDRIELREIQSSCGVENRATSDNVMRQERVAGITPDRGARSATIQRRVSPAGSHEAIPTTMEEPQGTLAVERPLNNAETVSAPAVLLELHEFLGTGVQAPRPIGPWPRGFDPQAFLRAIEEAWIAGIDEPDPLLFLETFKLGEAAE